MESASAESKSKGKSRIHFSEPRLPESIPLPKDIPISTDTDQQYYLNIEKFGPSPYLSPSEAYKMFPIDPEEPEWSTMAYNMWLANLSQEDKRRFMNELTKS